MKYIITEEMLDNIGNEMCDAGHSAEDFIKVGRLLRGVAVLTKEHLNFLSTIERSITSKLRIIAYINQGV